MRTAEWHFCPQLSDTGSTAVAADIISVEIGVPDPVEYAQRWAAVLGLPLEAGLTSLTLARGELRFVSDADGGGLRSVRFAASSPETGGREATLCGVTFEVAATGSGDG